MRIKRLLVIGGIILILTGMILMMWPEPQEEKSIWEKIPDEEIHTYIEEEGATENIPEYETDCCIKEGAADSGSDSTSERDGDEEEPPAAGSVIELTYDEAAELKKLATAEAEGEGCEGQWLVMSVVWNRVQDPEYPSTIHEVINQYGVTKEGKKIYQFSCVADGRIETAKPSGDSGAALARLEAGDVSPGIIAFEVTGTDILEKWFKFAFNYKNHNFFTKK